MNRSRTSAVVLGVTLLLAACGGAAPSATPSSGAAGSAAPGGVPAAPVPTATPASTATPRPTARPAPSGTVYVVKRGDTLYAIATRHHLTLKALLAANPQIANANVLKIGQRIVIPTA
jgi:LysM repeat protein